MAAAGVKSTVMLDAETRTCGQGRPRTGEGKLGRGQLGLLGEILPSPGFSVPCGERAGGSEMPASMVQNALRVRCSHQR